MAEDATWCEAAVTKERPRYGKYMDLALGRLMEAPITAHDVL